MTLTSIEFTLDEVREVHDILSLVCRRAPGMNLHLESALGKFREVGLELIGPRPDMPDVETGLITRREKLKADEAQSRRDRGIA